MKTAIAFLESPGRPDYGQRIWRRRWAAAFPADLAAELSRGAAASEEFSAADAWLLVLDEKAQPAASPRFPDPPAGAVLAASPAAPADAAVHTLRELEELPAPPQAPPGDPRKPPAIAFRAADFPPCPGETVEDFLERLLAGGSPKTSDPAFRALAVGDPSRRERPELTARIPPAARKLLDVGCGSGGSGAALSRRFRDLHVTGIEKDPEAAARAASNLHRVLPGDAVETLARLSSEGESFDAFLFADVLEHLDDPVEPLRRARALARPGATLVASVPNAGHLSLVRDLARGRFDPVPAGLADVGHLRWFTRVSLVDALEEAGWRVESVEGEKAAAAAGAREFEAEIAAWPALDRDSIETYQWIAVAAADPDTLIGSLETPAPHRIRSGGVNRFRGMVLDTNGDRVRSVRISIDGGAAVDYPCDRDSADVAVHLPHLPAAAKCRFEFDAFLPAGAGVVRFEAVAESGRVDPLFDYDVATPRERASELERTSRALEALPLPDPDIVFLTQGHRDARAYQDSILPGILNLKRYLAESGVEDARIESVLDFGCGSGRLLAGWLPEAASRRLAGCDTSEPLIEWARRNLPSKIRLERTAALPPLPFGGGSFDLVTAISVFTHLRRRSQELWAEELGRVLSPGGILVVTLHGRPYVRLFQRGRHTEFEKSGHLEIESAADGANESASFHSEKDVPGLFPAFEMIGSFPAGRIGGRRVLFPLASIQDVYVLRRKGR